MDSKIAQSSPPSPTTADTSTGRLTGTMGVPAILFMVVAAAAPLTTVGGVMLVGFSQGNGLGFPVMYLGAAVVLLLFAAGLTKMARVVPNPGAFYTYIRYGLGDRAGAAAAFVAVAAYLFAPAGVLCLLGVQLDVTVQDLGGPSVPWWIYSLAMVAILGFLSYRHIDLTARVLGVVLVGEVLIVLIMSAVVLVTGGESGLSTTPFEPSSIFSGSIGIAITFGITGFIGVEATAVFRDEARDPVKTIPRATYAGILCIGIFYTIAAYAYVVAWGEDNVVREATEDPAGMFVSTAREYLGVVGVLVGQALLLFSLFACALAFQNVMARYVHSMARDSLLWTRLAEVHPRHSSPHRSALLVTSVVAATVVVAAVTGLDPATQVVAWSSALITAGVMILMVLTSIAVVVYFRRARTSESLWATAIAPILGAVGLAIAGVLFVVNFPLFVGGSYTLAGCLLMVFPVMAIVGVLRGRAITREGAQSDPS